MFDEATSFWLHEWFHEFGFLSPCQIVHIASFIPIVKCSDSTILNLLLMISFGFSFGSLAHLFSVSECACTDGVTSTGGKMVTVQTPGWEIRTLEKRTTWAATNTFSNPLKWHNIKEINSSQIFLVSNFFSCLFFSLSVALFALLTIYSLFRCRGQNNQLEIQLILRLESHLLNPDPNNSNTTMMVTPETSKLLGRLVRNNPRGPVRLPPSEQLTSLRAVAQELGLGRRFWRSRDPDFLLELLQSQGWCASSNFSSQTSPIYLFGWIFCVSLCLG